MALNNGTVGMAFLGTDTYSGRPSFAPTDTEWHLWVVTGNAESGQFTAQRGNLVQRGPVCMGFGDGTRNCPPEARNLLDFIGSTWKGDEYIVTFADGCVDLCEEDGTMDSRSSVFTTAIT